MNPHKALIVDDERLARRELAYLLRQHPEIEIVGEAGSVEEAAESIKRLHPDLVFLDIQMPGASGFDLFDRVPLAAHVIFVTAHDEFALRAFEVNALDYLMKPLHPRRLHQAIERYLRRSDGNPAPSKRLALEDSIFVTVGQTPRFVKLNSVVCILAEGDYTRVIGPAGSIGLVLKPLKEWEQLLPERHFCRIQRSAIINCENVLRFEPCPHGGYRVYMKHLEHPLLMSRRYGRCFRARFEV
jgi:two-component system LytT family response regulator